MSDYNCFYTANQNMVSNLNFHCSGLSSLITLKHKKDYHMCETLVSPEQWQLNFDSVYYTTYNEKLTIGNVCIVN